MRSFEYLTILYRPDHETGEFVNVGLIIFDQKENELRSAFIQRMERVKNFFPHFDHENLKNKLSNFNEKLSEFLSKSRISSIKEVLSILNIGDDSRFYISQIRRGIDHSIDVALSDLSSRLLHAHEVNSPARSNVAPISLRQIELRVTSWQIHLHRHELPLDLGQFLEVRKSDHSGVIETPFDKFKHSA